MNVLFYIFVRTDFSRFEGASQAHLFMTEFGHNRVTLQRFIGLALIFAVRKCNNSASSCFISFHPVLINHTERLTSSACPNIYINKHNIERD